MYCIFKLYPLYQFQEHTAIKAIFFHCPPEESYIICSPIAPSPLPYQPHYHFYSFKSEYAMWILLDIEFMIALWEHYVYCAFRIYKCTHLPSPVDIHMYFTNVIFHSRDGEYHCKSLLFAHRTVTSIHPYGCLWLSAYYRVILKCTYSEFHSHLHLKHFSLMGSPWQSY